MRSVMNPPRTLRMCLSTGRGACLMTVVALLVGCGSREASPPAADTPAAPPAAAPRASAAPVQIEMKNVRLHMDDGIVLNVRDLRGEMVSQAQGPPVFDDP